MCQYSHSREESYKFYIKKGPFLYTITPKMVFVKEEPKTHELSFAFWINIKFLYLKNIISVFLAQWIWITLEKVYWPTKLFSFKEWQNMIQFRIQNFTFHPQSISYRLKNFLIDFCSSINLKLRALKRIFSCEWCLEKKTNLNFKCTSSVKNST